MDVQVEKLPKSTLKLAITVPVEKVKQAYSKTLDDLVKNTEIKGFRKGAAPKKMVEEKANPSDLYGEVLNNLLQTYYPQAIKEKHINPISNPKVEIKEFDMDKDLVFIAEVAVKPEVKITDNYIEKLKEKLESKKESVRKIKEDKLRRGEPIGDIHEHLHTNEVVQVLNECAQVDIPNILVEEETDRMMSQLINQAQTLGFSLDQYLKAQNKTKEELREEYDKSSINNLKTEFVLAYLANERKVEASDNEIEEMAKATGDQNIIDKTNDPVQRWYIKSILEKNKLLTQVIEEVEGKKTEKKEKTEEKEKGKDSKSEKSDATKVNN